MFDPRPRISIISGHGLGEPIVYQVFYMERYKGQMDVSKNRSGPPKWMVYNGSKPYFLMDDLGVKTHIFGNTQMFFLFFVIDFGTP